MIFYRDFNFITVVHAWVLTLAKMGVKGTIFTLSPERNFKNWEENTWDGGLEDIGRQPMKDSEPWEKRINKVSPTT